VLEQPLRELPSFAIRLPSARQVELPPQRIPSVANCLFCWQKTLDRQNTHTFNQTLGLR
jgi:hypothetical protein